MSAQRTNESAHAMLVRGTAYLALWIILIGGDPFDLAVGAFAAAVATWTSLRLLPPGAQPLRLGALPGLVLYFIRLSVIAGVDVARRALAPRLRLRPGVVAYATRYPRGLARNAFASLSSLLPGTVPIRDDEQGLLYHCLDVDQPIATELAAEETVLSRVLAQVTRS